MEVLTQAVELAPRDANVLHELGWAYQQSGQSNRALEYLEKAHKQDAQSPMILKSYGQVLHVVGRIAEAQEHLENARRKNPNDLGAVIYLSELYQALGMLDEGKALLEGAVQRGQRQPTILVGLARIERQQKNVEKALGYLEGISSGDSTLPVQTRAAAEFELGAIREQMGEFGAAFTAYESANGLLNYKYNPRGTTQQVDALIAAYSVEACSEMTRSGDVSELPIFVLGMPRSGTTLVEQIVAAHAQAAGGGELGYFGQACQPLMSDASGGAGGWNPSQMLRLDTETLAQSAVGYLERLRTHGDGVVTRITDKMPTNFFYVGSIAQLLGGARIVHCRRHPLDTCLSIFATPLSPALGFSTDLRALGHFYGEYARLMAHWRSVMDELGIGWLELDYEDLIADAELKSRELIDFCGLTWEDDCLEFHKVKRTVSTASIHQVRQPIYGSSVARWKRFERELAPLVEALGDLADS